MSKKIRFKGIVATLAQIAADAFAGRISWASDLARPVHYYTDSDYAVLARKDVAETFPGVKITNQAGPVARMVQAGTDGTQSAVSAETARSTIDAAQTAHTHTVANLSNLGANWSGLLTSAKPTTLSGYGITDAQAALGYTPVNKAGDTMTGGLTLSAGNLNVNAGVIQTAGVTRISSGGAGTLTTLSTTGMMTAAQATVQDLPTGRMVSTTTGGRLQALDAAGSRALIEVAGAELLSVPMSHSATNSTCWMKLCQITLTAQNQRARVVVEVSQMTNGMLAHCIKALLRIDQSQTMAAGGPLLEATQETVGDNSTAFAVLEYTVDQNDASAKVISVWVPVVGTYVQTEYSVILQQKVGAAIVWGRNVTPVTVDPGGTKFAPLGRRSGGTTLTTLNISSLTGSRMLSLDGSKNVQSLDAAGSRALIDAQASLGYTPLNKAGDTGINSASSFQWTGDDPRTWIQGGLISVYWGGVSHALNTRSNASSITVMRGSSTSDDTQGGLDFLTGKLSVTTPGAATAYNLDIANGVLKVANVAVVGSRKTGWAAASGTATRTTFATSTVTLQQLAERMKALIDDLTAHGLIGS